jgi:exodeoxyribonuclease V beta subunit
VLVTPRAFDLTGELPSGVTVLEASAGTGKTYTIAGLAARYVAEGTPLERILLITFTRAATGELRERVRERLMSVERALVPDAPASEDPVVQVLGGAEADQVQARRRDLARALTEFDAATIATIHSFCQEVLGGLGISGDLEPDVEFVADLGDLRTQVVDDLYVRRFYRGNEPPALKRGEAQVIGERAIASPDAAIAVAETELGKMRVRLAKEVRRELEDRKRRQRVMDYDDLLMRLRDALAGDSGETIAARLRERYDIALVDEFQDTDPVQWQIMRAVFGAESQTLVLIGDPKQAIYSFRGADVYAYLEAASEAPVERTLDVNWRSDQGLIDAYDALFHNAKLGHPRIPYREVRAAHGAARLTGAPIPAPLRVRVVDRDQDSIELTPRTRQPTMPSAREHIAADLADDVVTLLESGAHVTGEPVRPGHIAVLVRTNASAGAIRAALARAGVPAVLNGAGSVFATDAARDWLWLLLALERPSSARRARTAAMTPFLGWSAERVAEAGEADRDVVRRKLHDWARILRLRGVASVVQTITLAERLPERVLATETGERDLTDLRHVGELLHAAASEERMGTTALTGWLRRRIDEADGDAEHEDRARRLESDAEAVQVLTVHRSKGLEFPIVYAPALWECSQTPDGKKPVAFHDPDAGDRRTIDVGLEGAGFARHRRQALEEQRGEDLRLAYVALTRARHQAILWWVGASKAEHSPLGRLLFSRDEEGNVAAEGSSVPGDATAWARFEELAGSAPDGCVSVEWSRLTEPLEWSGEARDDRDLSAAVFDRRLDLRWRRTSYSALTAPAHEPLVASEPEEDVLDDEPAVEGGRDGGPIDPALEVPSLLAGMPVGVEIGTLFHRLLERTDFAAADLSAELRARVAEVQTRRAVDVGDPEAVVAGLRAALETPLGPLAEGSALRDVGMADRLDELGFELPLVGGDAPSGTLTVSAIADVLRRRLDAGDPLAGYAERLVELGGHVRGYLTGSLDLVLRLPGPRYAVVDYKTNWLGGPDEELVAWHYRPEALAAEMQRRHYGLQALIYTVALHRYLRWRVPRYEVERDLAGVLYLFVRGMTGRQTPLVEGAPCGVFAWRPPTGLVEELSEVFDRG